MANYECLKTFQNTVNGANKEGLREVKLSTKFLNEVNDAILALLVNRANDYEKMVDTTNKAVKSNNEPLILNGGEW